MSEDKVTIISLAPYEVFGVEREEGHYRMAARKEGERYSSLVVRDGTTHKDFGEGQKEPQTTPARKIAEDLTRTCINHGVFIVDGDRAPTEKEITDAEEALRETYAIWIEDADNEWARSHDFKRITMHARLAAGVLNQRREWASRLDAAQVPCKACQELVYPNIPRCPKCRAVLNWEAAREFSLLDAFEEQRGIELGKLMPLGQKAAAPPIPDFEPVLDDPASSKKHKK